MALSALKTWSAGEILTASDLNSEFANIYTNGASMFSPALASLDMNAQGILLDDDQDTHITADTDDRIDFAVGGVDMFRLDGTTASVANGLDVVGTVAANPVRIVVTGTADRGIRFDAKDSEEMLILAAVTDAVNEVTISSAATGANPTIACTGEADTGITIQNSEGEEILILDSVATSVNEITIRSAATGTRPIIAATGEADNGLEFHNDQAEEILILQSAANSVNEITITSAAAGSDATIIASSSGADAGITIQGKGAGTVKLGDASLVFPDADGTATQVMQTDGAGTLSFGPPPLPRGYIGGLQLTRTDANTITVGDGECRNTGNDRNMLLAASLAKDIDATWVAGAGGGLNATDFASGTSDCEADTWYHFFLIEDGAGTVDAGFDKSVTATNLLADSGYTKYRRIGSVRTDGSKDIIAFTQAGETVVWDVLPPLSIAATATDYSVATKITLNYVPPNVSVDAIFVAAIANATIGLVMAGSSTTSTTLSATAADLGSFNNGQTQSQVARLPTNTSQQVTYKASDNSSDLSVQVHGWVDTRGRFD